MATNTVEAEFDAYAQAYEEALNQGLSVSGEGSDYFAKKRIQWTAGLVGSSLESVLDFGCGVGIAIPELKLAFKPSLTWGYDPSSAAIDRALVEHGDETTKFSFNAQQIPKNSFQLAYCNGVFHHIPPDDREAALSIVYQSLRPGGWFAFWENNPWNPGTRYVMSKIPFDNDAITITPPKASQLLIRAGFRIAFKHSKFIFPRSLSLLRPLEKLVYWLPIGAQYLVLAQKPE